MEPSIVRLIAGIIYGLAFLLVFGVYGLDKHRARRQQWRVPESLLLALALLCPIGALAGMLFFRHKTRKPKFIFGIPAILVLELTGFLLAFSK